MKVKIAVNGTTKIVLVPENDIDRAVLKDLAKQEITCHEISSQTAVVDEIINEGVVITKKTKEFSVDNSK